MSFQAARSGAKDFNLERHQGHEKNLTTDLTDKVLASQLQNARHGRRATTSIESFALSKTLRAWTPRLPYLTLFCIFEVG